MTEAKTIVELAGAWHAEQDIEQEGAGDLMKIDRALIETPVQTCEDVVALLEVAIRDFRIGHENAEHELVFFDNGEELIWKAIGAAHHLLTQRPAARV